MVKVTIDIIGYTKEGKSTIAAVIGKAVHDLGFKVNIKDDFGSAIAKKGLMFDRDMYFKEKIIQNTEVVEIKTTQLVRENIVRENKSQT